MVNSCYLCNRKASKADNISLHRFPKSLDIRIKWLNACGLTTNDDVSRTCLCSRHFKNEDICQSNIFGSVKSSIKRNAVPTLYLTDSLTINNSNESSSETPISELTNDENGVANRSLSFFSGSNIVDDNNVVDIMEKSSKKNNRLNNIEIQVSNNSNMDFVLVLVNPDENSDYNQCIENRMADSSSERENTISDENNFPNQCQKRKYFEPRYINEISSLDFATPKRTKRTIQLIKKTDQNKSQKIKQLQRQARNLQKQVQSLQDLINHPYVN